MLGEEFIRRREGVTITSQRYVFKRQFLPLLFILIYVYRGHLSLALLRS